MKKLSNNNGVIKSSTLAGQRELLREYRNKINEIVESVTALENREAKHELDVITSMQYLEKRIEELKKPLKPYTAMRSTGESEYCNCENAKTNFEWCLSCDKPIKPQEDVKTKELEKMIFYSKGWDGTYAEAHDLSSSILAIVKGE